MSRHYGYWSEPEYDDDFEDDDPEQDFNNDESLDQACDDANSFTEAMEAFFDGRS